MLDRLRITLLLAACCGLPAGCPSTSPSGAGIGSSPFTQTGAGGSGLGGGGSVTADNSDVDGALADEFPDCSPVANADSWRADVLRLVNQERQQAGVPVLVSEDTLARQAEQYACEMIQYDFFAHVNPVTHTTLADRAQDFGYDFQVIGENLAAGQRSPEEVVEDWMQSPGHRQNILDPRFTEIGIAVRQGGKLGLYWVQEFGRPADAGAFVAR